LHRGAKRRWLGATPVHREECHDPFPCDCRRAGADGRTIGRPDRGAARDAGRGAARDAAIGEIESALAEIEEIIILACVCGDDEIGRKPARSARQAGRKARMAGGVGLRRAQHLVVARDQTHIDIGERRGAG